MLTGPGSDLLSRALRHSTMGAEDFHGRVRDGIGCRLLAITTRFRQHIIKSEAIDEERFWGIRVTVFP